MKRILFTILFLVAFLAGYTQLNNSGSITVENGASLVVMGDFTSTGAGSIDIDGTVQLKGDFVNNGAATAVAAGSTGLLAFNGTSAQEITGSQSTTFSCAVEVNNAAGVALTNTAGGNDQTFAGALALTNGSVTLNEFDLTFGGTISGVTASQYVRTNSSGQLKASVGGTAVTFPVGDASSYNPVILANAGATDVYGVNYSGSMPAGWTGTTNYVMGSWFVTEGLAGGSDLTVTPQWNGSQEQTDFDRTDCSVGVSGDLGATVDWSASGAAAGLDPYTRDGVGFTSVGHFLIGDGFYLAITLNLNLILYGAWNGTDMNTTLNDLGLIPTADPYSVGVTVPSIPAGVVDWVLVELRDKTNNENVLYTRAFFLNSAGELVNPDGVTGGKLQAIPRDQYYVSVKHRNHLGVMTANTVDFTAGSASFDFTDPSSAVFGTNPMYSDGVVMMLWAGDTDSNGQVIYLNGPSDLDPILYEVFYDPTNVDFLEYWIVEPVYNSADTDLNGTVAYLNGPSDLDPLLASVFYDPSNVDFLEYWIVQAQLPELLP
jgi:hypothetical protein